MQRKTMRQQIDERMAREKKAREDRTKGQPLKVMGRNRRAPMTARPQPPPSSSGAPPTAAQAADSGDRHQDRVIEQLVDKHTAAELREQCRAWELDTRGNKTVLATRLLVEMRRRDA